MQERKYVQYMHLMFDIWSGGFFFCIHIYLAEGGGGGGGGGVFGK